MYSSSDTTSPAPGSPDVGASDVGAGASDVGAGASDVGAGASDVGAGAVSPVSLAPPLPINALAAVLAAVTASFAAVLAAVTASFACSLSDFSVVGGAGGADDFGTLRTNSSSAGGTTPKISLVACGALIPSTRLPETATRTSPSRTPSLAAWPVDDATRILSFSSLSNLSPIFFCLSPSNVSNKTEKDISTLSESAIVSSSGFGGGNGEPSLFM